MVLPSAIDMQIPKDKLERVLKIYKPEFRYLVDATTNYPLAEGKFSLGDTYYTTKSLEHMTVVEAQLCMNQLCYATFGEWLSRGTFGHIICFEDYLKLMQENMFVIESNTRFKELIPKNQNIHGKIELIRHRKCGSLFLAFIDYNLEQENAIGRIQIALRQ